MNLPRLPPLRVLPLRSLVAANSGGDRIFFHNIWFRGHNNRRYAQLLPRLQRLDAYMVTCSDRRLVRGVEFRALRRTRWVRNRLVFAAAARRYHYTFTTDIEQIPFIRGSAVVDFDDPRFTPAEVELLSRPNVKAYVVTTEGAARALEAMGLRTPWFVVPQGVDLSDLDAAAVAEVAARVRRPGEIAVGYVAAWLLTAGDRDGENALYNIDHLLDLWDTIRTEVPNARLWLVGQPSDRVRLRCRGRDDVLLLGRVPDADVLPYIANFDIALYPRRESPARFRSAMKITEQLGVGVPTVAYDLDETRVLEASGGGMVVTDPRSFAAAVRHLATDEAARKACAQAAAVEGATLDWNRLAAMYERDILDPLLCDVPPS